MKIEDSVAFVTGAASGLGLAIAESLLREGAQVVMTDVNEADLALVASRLGENAMPFVLDVTDRAAWAAAREAVRERFGEVSILVNNAGIGPSLQLLDDTPEAHFDAMIAIKLGGTFNGIKTFVPAMRERRAGHVVNTASMAGLVASAQLGPYTASKFGVVGMSEVMRAELEDDDVGVSVFCPGLVRTNLGRSQGRTSEAHNIEGGIDPAVAGDAVVAGIRENQLYILTHGEYRDAVGHRAARLDRAFASTPIQGSSENLPGAAVAKT